MAMIKNAEVHYVKCDPKRPSSAYNKKNPTWEVQIRTSDEAQRAEWKKMNLQVKLLTMKDPNDDDEDAPKVPVLTADGKKIYRVNLKKGPIKKDGEKAEPVKVVNGALEDVDPNTIGNGSICNIRVFQYEYKNDEGEGIASMLMAIQVKKHIVYVPKARDDDFDVEDTEVIMAPDNDGEDDKPAKPKEKGALPAGKSEDDF